MIKNLTKCIWDLVRYSTIPLHSEATKEAVHMNKLFHSHFYSLLAPQIRFQLKNKFWHNINVVFRNTEKGVKYLVVCNLFKLEISGFFKQISPEQISKDWIHKKTPSIVCFTFAVCTSFIWAM